MVYDRGTPLPLLFILVIDQLHRLLAKATDLGLLSKIGGRAVRFRTSIYADDAVIFVMPTATDMANLKQLLTRFGEVTA